MRHNKANMKRKRKKEKRVGASRTVFFTIVDDFVFDILLNLKMISA